MFHIPLECSVWNVPNRRYQRYRRRETAMTASTPLIFLLGGLIGVLAGGALCVRYLRHEIAADIGPRLRRLQMQLDSLESAIHLVVMTRDAEIRRQAAREPVCRVIGGRGQGA